MARSDGDDGRLTPLERARQDWGLPSGPRYDEEGNEVQDSESDTQGESSSTEGGSNGPAAADKAAAKEREALGIGQDTSKDTSASAEKEILNEDGSGFWAGGSSGKSKRSWRARIFNRKSAIGGGIVGVLIGGGFGVFSIISGPGQVVQLAQMLDIAHLLPNQNASESRVGRMFEYLRTQNDPSKRNVGYIMEKVSTKYIESLSSDGIVLDYTEPNGRQSRRLQSVIISNVDGEVGGEIAERFRREGYTVNPDGTVNLREMSVRQRRQALKISVDLQKKGKAASYVGHRILTDRAGVSFHVLTDRKKPARERLVDWRSARKEERSQQVKEGVDTTDGRRTTGSEATDEEGNPVRVNDDAAGEANAVIDEGRGATNLEGRNALSSRFKSIASGAVGGAAIVIGTMCTVRSVGQEIPAYQHANITMPMIRMTWNAISIGSQVMAGQDVSLDEVGSFTDDFYDEETKTSIWDGAAMQATMNKPITGPEAEVKPSDVGDKPVLFDIIDNIPALGTVCTINDSVGNILRGIPLVGSVVDAFDSVVEGAINAGLSVANVSIDELMERLVAFLSGDLVDTFAKGAALGNIYGIGGRLAGNEMAIGQGGTVMAAEDTQELETYLREERIKEFKQRPLLARLFDTHDVDSVASKTLMQNSNLASAQSFVGSLASLPTNLFGMFSSNIKKLSPSASAATTPGYDFGVPQYGFTIEELEDETYADPYANAEYIEDADNDGARLRELNERYRKCFVTYVDPDRNYALVNGASINYMTDEYRRDCSKPTDPAELETFNRYRFYLLDNITARSLACYEGLDEAACAELGFGGGGGQAVNPGGSGHVNPEGYSFPLAPQTQAVSGIDGGHHDGTPAFDLFSTDSAPVYALFNGTPTRINTSYGGVQGCSSIQFRADDGFYYWYGHLKNVTAQVDVPVPAGTQIAQIADQSMGSDCYGGGPHLHIDRGCTRNGVPQPGGTDACRDPDFIPFLRALWETLPSAN